MSDRPSLCPPCPGALSYYSRHGRDPAFTEAGPGRRFRELHARHLRLLEWPGPPHDALSVPGEPGKRYHLILPSFFRLLDTLHRDGRAFAVIFRTFGADLPRALQAVSSALHGQHPQFPALRDVAVSGALRVWRDGDGPTEPSPVPVRLFSDCLARLLLKASSSLDEAVSCGGACVCRSYVE